MPEVRLEAHGCRICSIMGLIQLAFEEMPSLLSLSGRKFSGYAT
jgi:hypothetical protein